MEKKSFPPSKLKMNKSKAPWAFPLAERKINPPPHAQIKLAWKVHCPSGHGLSTLHTKYSLKKKTSPPTSHHPHPGRKLQCQTLSRKMVCSRQPRMDNRTDSGEASFNIPTSFNSFIHPLIRSYCPSGFRGGFIPLSVRLQGRFHSSFNIYQLHREQAVTGRIFQALPTQTDTTIALIYRID